MLFMSNNVRCGGSQSRIQGHFAHNISGILRVGIHIWIETGMCLRVNMTVSGTPETRNITVRIVRENGGKRLRDSDGRRAHASPGQECRPIVDSTIQASLIEEMTLAAPERKAFELPENGCRDRRFRFAQVETNT